MQTGISVRFFDLAAFGFFCLFTIMMILGMKDQEI